MKIKNYNSLSQITKFIKEDVDVHDFFNTEMVKNWSHQKKSLCEDYSIAIRFLVANKTLNNEEKFIEFKRNLIMNLMNFMPTSTYKSLSQITHLLKKDDTFKLFFDPALVKTWSTQQESICADYAIVIIFLVSTGVLTEDLYEYLAANIPLVDTPKSENESVIRGMLTKEFLQL